MNLLPTVSLVRTLFTPQGNFASVVENGRHGRPGELVPGAQIQVVRFDTEAQDLIYQTFAIGWRHPGTSRVDNRVSFRGWADPNQLVVGAKLTRWCLAGQAEEKVAQRINDALRHNLKSIKGEIPCETDFAKPLAYHPTGVVEYHDFRGEPQVLITRTHPGADAFNHMVPPVLLEQGYTMVEALERVTVQNTKLDMSNLGHWIAVRTDSLKQPRLGVDMLVSLAECQAIHEAHLVRQSKRNERNDRQDRQERLRRGQAAAAKVMAPEFPVACVDGKAEALPVQSELTTAGSPSTQAEG